MSNQDESDKDKARMDDNSHIQFIDANITNRAPTDQSFLLDPVPPPSSEFTTSTNNATAATSSGNAGASASAGAPISQIQIASPWLTNPATNAVLGATQSQGPTVSQLIQHQFQSLNPTNVVQQPQPQTIVHNQLQPQLNLFSTATIFQANQPSQPGAGPSSQPKKTNDQLRQVQVQVQPQQQQHQPTASIFTVQPQQLLPHPALINTQFQPLNNIPLVIPNVGSQPLPSTVSYVSIPPPTSTAPMTVNSNAKAAQTNKRKLNAPVPATVIKNLSTSTSPEEEKQNSITSSTSSSGASSGLMPTGAPAINFGAIPRPAHVASRSHGAGSSGQPNMNITNINLPETKRARQKSPATTRKDATSTVVTATSGSNKKIEDMTPEERRRHERNTREQQRSHKISQQIKELRNVLSESKVPFKQNKYSILISVVDYIKQLQQRAGLLDNEHNKLVNTIQQTNEMVKTGVIDKSDVAVGVGNDVELLCARGLDYKAIYEQCAIPLGVAALDGRLLMCNPKFEEWTGLSKQALESRTLFGLLSASIVDEVFHALGTMLKNKTDGQSQCQSQQDLSNHKSVCSSEGIRSEANASAKDSPTGSGGVKPSDGNGSDGSGDGSGSGTSADKASESTAFASSHDSGDDNITNSGNDKVCVGYWCGTLPPPREDIQINISVTRTADGMPKFFSCALSLISKKRDLVAAGTLPLSPSDPGMKAEPDR